MKKLLATILALVMALGVTTLSWADGVEPRRASFERNAARAGTIDV